MALATWAVLRYTDLGKALRAAGHRIADYIYEKLIGEPGYFSTRIAYVVKHSGRYELQIADADGTPSTRYPRGSQALSASRAV